MNQDQNNFHIQYQNETSNIHNQTTIQPINTFENENINNNNKPFNNSDMKQCKKCKELINKNAKVCPHCRSKQDFPIWVIFLIVFIFIVIFSSPTDSDYNDNKTNDTSETSNNIEKKEKFSYTVTDEYNDYLSHYVEGIVKNNTDKDYSYVQIEFICYDKDGNNLGTAVSNTNNLLGQQTWKFKAIGLFTDRTADHCDFHKVTGW